jgi:tripartite-type tricarboxylate transporter receptor subunit TctC
MHIVYVRAASIACATGWLACIPAAYAQTPYPTKPVRLVVPFAPGGGTDILARMLGQKLRESLGQTFVVDNRAGAGGNVGAELVAKSPADGYTLLMGTISTHAVNISLYKNLPYHPTRDFSPVARVADVPNILVVFPGLPAKTTKEFIELARSAPKPFNYSSAGNGTSGHLTAELFKSMLKVELTHIPYKGAGPATSDVIAGQVQATFGNILSAMPHVKSGRLRALGVTGDKRSAALPEVPTIADTVPGFVAVGWFGVFTPKGTPAAVVARLNSAINAALELPDVRERMAVEGAEPGSGTAKQFGELVEREIVKWGDLVRATGARPDS